MLGTNFTNHQMFIYKQISFTFVNSVHALKSSQQLKTSNISMGVKVKQMQFTTVHYSKLINLVFIYYLTVLMLSRRSLFSLSDGNENAFATVVNVQLQSSELIHCEKRRRKYPHQTKRKEYCNKKKYLVKR